ncbi:MAG TPA: sensor histidine kinase KdpD [Bryobacteraceae bacterium]|nr:sensor histidine kinase KdpD [Bryobacteraceae bacterium]
MPETQRGKLKLFMGYAAGVGKTYRMLEEAHELRARGVDVVVGYFEPHGRADTILKAEGLEMIPRRRVPYRGTVFEEMDADAILERRPRTCVVDEFPHTNVPGSDRAKRWEDVHALLDAGIDVLATMNIQHLESLNDQVWHIAGVRVRETVPDWVVEQADEVVMIDLTPRALLNRLQRGVVYGREKTERALQNFFREPTLVALRELALRQAAHEVESRTAGNGARTGLSMSPHKLLVLVTAAPDSAMVIRRAKRMGDFLRAECFAVAVQHGGSLNNLPGPARAAVERHLNFARNLHIETRVIEGDDTAPALVEFARRNGVTQIFLARPGRHSWYRPWRRDLVQRIVTLAKDMQVVIVSRREPARSQAPIL